MPQADAVSAMSEAEKEALKANLSLIDAIKRGIPEKTLETLDFSVYQRVAMTLTMEELGITDDYVRFAIPKRFEVASGETDLPTPSFTLINTATHEAAPIVTFENGQAAVSAVSAVSVADGETVYGILPAGEYRIEETVDGDWNMTLTVNGQAADGAEFSGKVGEFLELQIVNSRPTTYARVSNEEFGINMSSDSYELAEFEIDENTGSATVTLKKNVTVARENKGKFCTVQLFNVDDAPITLNLGGYSITNTQEGQNAYGVYDERGAVIVSSGECAIEGTSDADVGCGVYGAGFNLNLTIQIESGSLTLRGSTQAISGYQDVTVTTPDDYVIYYSKNEDGSDRESLSPDSAGGWNLTGIMSDAKYIRIEKAGEADSGGSVPENGKNPDAAPEVMLVVPVVPGGKAGAEAEDTNRNGATDRGDRVIVTVIPDAGKELDHFVDGNGSVVTLDKVGENTYAFTIGDFPLPLRPVFKDVTVPPQTGDSSAAGVWMLLLTLSAAAAAALGMKRRANG